VVFIVNLSMGATFCHDVSHYYLLFTLCDHFDFLIGKFFYFSDWLSDPCCRVSRRRNPMLRFGVLPSEEVRGMLSLHAEMLVSPNATNEAA